MRLRSRWWVLSVLSILSVSTAGSLHAQAIFLFQAASSDWGNTTSNNWGAGTGVHPGSSSFTNNDIAYLTTTTTVGLNINFGTSSPGVGNSMYLGAIDYNPGGSGTNTWTFGSNGSTSGTLLLNTATVNGQSNVYLSSRSTSPSASTWTIAPTNGGSGTMGLALEGGVGKIITDANNTLAISATIVGAGGFNKMGSGTLTLTGGNIYSGTTTISEGTLNAGTIVVAFGSSSLGNASSSVVLGDATHQGTLNYLGSVANYTRGFTINAGGGQLINSGAGTLTVSSVGITAGGLFTVGGASQSISISSVISGSGGVTKTGADFVTVSAANTYSGTTTVNAGTLLAGVASVANVSGAFGNNSAVVMANTSGATLNLNGFNTQIGSLTGGGSSGGLVFLGSATLTVGGDNTSPAAYSGTISGSGGSLVKIGTGTLTFAGSNQYTGTTTISAGTISTSILLTTAFGNVSSPIVLGDSTNQGTLLYTYSGPTGANYFRGFTVNAGGGQFINNSSNNLMSISTFGITIANSGTFILGGTSNISDTSVISGAGNLAKTGVSTVTLAANDTYLGTTSVSGGTLLVNGTHAASGAYTVNNNATLGGTGTINAAMNIGTTGPVSAGLLAPGSNGPGRLKVNGAVTFTSTTSSIFNVELNGTTAGTNYDQFTIGSTGALSLGGATLNVSLGFTPGNSDRFFIVDDQFAGTVNGTFNGLAEGAVFISGNNQFQISYLGDFSTNSLTGGNDIVLYNYLAVPEPGTIALLGLTGFFGLQYYLRRQAKAAGTAEAKSDGQEPPPEFFLPDLCPTELPSRSGC